MGRAFDKLVGIGSEPLGVGAAGSSVPLVQDLLVAKNGFLAFENALLVMPFASDGGVPSVSSWNRRPERAAYPSWRDATVFAFDAFFDHFAVLDGRIVRLNPYTGEIENHSTSLDEWAEKLLRDYDFETGWSVARAWQASNRALRPTERLVPKVPFIFGGQYEVSNVVAVRADVAIGYVASLYGQVRDTPDGGQIELHGWNPMAWQDA